MSVFFVAKKSTRSFRNEWLGVVCRRSEELNPQAHINGSWVPKLDHVAMLQLMVLMELEESLARFTAAANPRSGFPGIGSKHRLSVLPFDDCMQPRDAALLCHRHDRGKIDFWMNVHLIRRSVFTTNPDGWAAFETLPADHESLRIRLAYANTFIAEVEDFETAVELYQFFSFKKCDFVHGFSPRSLKYRSIASCERTTEDAQLTKHFLPRDVDSSSSPFSERRTRVCARSGRPMRS